MQKQSKKLLINNLKVTRNNLPPSRSRGKVTSQQEVAQSYSDVYKLINANLWRT